MAEASVSLNLTVHLHDMHLELGAKYTPRSPWTLGLSPMSSSLQYLTAPSRASCRIRDITWPRHPAAAGKVVPLTMQSSGMEPGIQLMKCLPNLRFQVGDHFRILLFRRFDCGRYVGSARREYS